MPEVPGNPFDLNAPKPNAIRDDAGLAGFMLGKEAEEDMRAAEHRLASHVPRPTSPELKTHGSLEEGMTAREREDLKKQKEFEFENDPKYTRARLIKWAEKFNLGGENWVDEMFEFEPDGTAICAGALKLMGKGLTYLPKGIKEVYGFLSLTDNPIDSLENLPTSVGELGLRDIPAKEIPSGINIVGSIYLHANQKELTEDALTKGYNVEYVY